MLMRILTRVVSLLAFGSLLVAMVLGVRSLFVAWLGPRAESLGVLVGLVATWAWVAIKIWGPRKARIDLIPLPPASATVMVFRCLDCDGDSFLKGPSGGLCTNYKCAGCGSEYDVGPGLMERICGD